MSEKSSLTQIKPTPRQRAWLTRLRPELQRLFPQETRHLDIRASGPPDLRTYSRLYPFTILADGLPLTDILVKVPHGRKGSDVHRAWRAYRLLARTFAERPHLDIPTALAAWDDPPALIMQRAEGESLHMRLRDCRSWGVESGCQLAQNFVERAGQWLALLHETPAPSWSQPAPDPLLQVAALLDNLQAHGLDMVEAQRIRQQISVLGSQTGEESAPLHGDYTLRNILCQPPHSIIALDTELTWKGNPALDIGWFIAALHFIDKWHLLLGEMAYPTTVISHSRELFLQGYASVRPLPPPEAIHGYTALRLLQRWAEYVTHQHNRSLAGLRTFVIRRAHQHFVRAILG